MISRPKLAGPSQSRGCLYRESTPPASCTDVPAVDQVRPFTKLSGDLNSSTLGKLFAALLQNPDFMKLAEAYGVRGVRAQGPEQLESSLRQALGIDAPTLIEVPVEMMPSPFE